MKCCNNENFEEIKRYAPKPKNPDGSIRWFLFRWDDGKDGYRKLVKCKNCGAYFLVQCFKLNKFADSSGEMHEEWYAVDNEHHADRLNREYTGVELEKAVKKIELV